MTDIAPGTTTTAAPDPWGGLFTDEDKARWKRDEERRQARIKKRTDALKAEMALVDKLAAPISPDGLRILLSSLLYDARGCSNEDGVDVEHANAEVRKALTAALKHVHAMHEKYPTWGILKPAEWRLR